MYLAQNKTLLARERFTVKLRKPRTVSLCFAQPPVYGGPQLSHQNKMLTSNSNHSQQIKNHSQQIQIAHSKLQITHSKLQITHSKLQIVHIKYKSFTSNTNRSHQIQIAHSKYKYGQ